jgi:ribosomal protein S18 acetylase RimI-like enzyme
MHTSSSISLNLDTSDTSSFHILSNSNLSITFRFLHPGDQSEVKNLCQDWFPITYPDQWYDDIVEDKKYFSLAACDTSTQQIIALIVANIFPLANCNREDQRILHRKFSYTTSVCYILILGVVKQYRRQGLAGILLENLLNKLNQHQTCKAIYLHVLYSNKQAIEFYQSKSFQYRTHLPYYYLIKGEHFDAYCFARYINGKKKEIFLFRCSAFYLGGYPPVTFADFLSNTWMCLIRINPCRLLNAMRYFFTNKLLFLDYYQRPSSYKQLSRVI